MGLYSRVIASRAVGIWNGLSVGRVSEVHVIMESELDAEASFEKDAAVLARTFEVVPHGAVADSSTSVSLLGMLRRVAKLFRRLKEFLVESRAPTVYG